MIIGIGTDIVDIDRIEHSLAEFGDRFRERIFTSGEIAYSESYVRSGERYAARFAAKEAARKAFGCCGPISGIGWLDIEVVTIAGGAPQLRFHGVAAELGDRYGVTKCHVSLSHATKQATAFVILEGEVR
jgi:holo-[acyl-carrier protein] synthase